MLANFGTAVSTISAAGDVQIVLANIHDRGPYITGSHPNAAGRARVTAAIDEVNTGIAAIADAESNVVLFDRHGWDTYIFTVYPIDGSGNITVGGEAISTTVNGDEPHHVVLADTQHLGTVASGLFVNTAAIPALNGLGYSLTPITESALIAEAGIV